MRLLLINPNTSTAVTELIAGVARDAAAPGTEFRAVTAPRGVPFIATRAEAAIAGAVVLELLAQHHAGCDAVIVAAFGDPGLGGAREISPVPVVGMAEAAMLTACMLGRRFSIIAFASAFEPWYRECVEYHGLAGRLASIRLESRPFSDVARVQFEKEDAIVELATRAAREDQADAVIFAGAPLAGMAARVAHRIPVPVIDGVAAAVKQAEALAFLRPRKASLGSFRAPEGKSSIGLDPALAAMLAGKALTGPPNS